MKILFCIIVLLITLFSGYAQHVIRIKDPHIVSQEKRQTFWHWDHWLPEPSYNRIPPIIGPKIQTNVHYMFVWGWLAPPKNKNYKKGPDIRPLSLTGLQNQRYGELLHQESQAEEIKKEVDETHKEALKEYQHIASFTTPADPLYLLYYKEKLSDLKNFDPNSTNPRHWGIHPKVWDKINQYGFLGQAKEDIIVLQDRYKMALNTDVPRGKRIMMYHDILIKWKKSKNYLSYINQQYINTIKAQQTINEMKMYQENKKYKKERSDAEIFTEILMKNKYFNN